MLDCCKVDSFTWTSDTFITIYIRYVAIRAVAVTVNTFIPFADTM